MKFDRRISRRSFLAAAGVTSAALALTACGGSSSSTAASSAASGASSAAAGTAQGGTLNIMLETEVQSLTRRWPPTAPPLRSSRITPMA